MSNALVRYQASLTRFQPQTLDEIVTIANLFEKSGMFPTDTGKTQTAAMLAVKILAGQELGFTPFAAANGMYIIKGKCAPGANLMAAKVKASGRYNYKVTKMADDEVSIDFYEDGKLVGASTFSAKDAAKAGTQNMQKFPRNMLFARALSNGVKWYCPDIFNGVAVYTADELGATVDYETGEIIEAQPEQPQHDQPVQSQQPSSASSLTELPEVEFMDGSAPLTTSNAPVDEPQTNGKSRPGQISKAALNTLHALGTAAYNGEWDVKRKALVKATTNGRTESSAELWQAEAQTLIGGLEKKVRKAYEALVDELSAGVVAVDPNVFVEINALSGVELAREYTKLVRMAQGQAEPVGK